MYENFKLCPDLKPGELCLVIEQYVEGQFQRCYHRHIRQHRLSDLSRRALLRSLVIKQSHMHEDHILACHVNSRGKNPSADGSLGINTSYPEPGVIRTYCGANSVAWIDAVIVADQFRQSSPKEATLET